MPAKILLADKSITIQKVVEMLFSGREYEVVCVSDGEAALNEAERIAPDVVLADVDLPRMDGYSLAAKLRKSPGLAQTPTILMMSRDDVYDHAKGKQAGINDTIVKPFESQELISKVKKAMAAAPARSSEPAPATYTRPQPSATAPRAGASAQAEPKQTPPNIFDIISEAPTASELKRTKAPAADETVYEVEPEVEEIASPFASEEATSLPIGDQALEEMRVGLGLTPQTEDPYPKMVTFESFDMDTASAGPATRPQSASASPSAPPAAHQAEIVTFESLDMAREAEKMFSPQQPAAPIPSTTPPALPKEELKAMVGELVTRMTEKYLNDMPLPTSPKIAEETVRSVVAEHVSKMAEKAFKDMPPPSPPKISEETIRRGLQDAVTKVAREMAQSIIEQVAWEVIPQLAEHLIKEEIEKIKAMK